MPWKVERRKDKFVVVRENGKVVAEHESKAKAMRQVRALYASEYWLKKEKQKQFASRSEAGRYAANIRWQGAGMTVGNAPDPWAWKILPEQYATLRREAFLKQQAVAAESAEGADAVDLLSKYVRSGHERVNGYLHGRLNTTGMTDEAIQREGQRVENLVKHFDDLAIELPADKMVFRGYSYNKFEDGPAPKVGDVFSSPGFQSTSADPDVAEKFTRMELGIGGYLFLKINVKQGTKVIIPPQGFAENEFEVLLKPGTKYRIVAAKRWGSERFESLTDSLEVEIVDE